MPPGQCEAFRAVRVKPQHRHAAFQIHPSGPVPDAVGVTHIALAPRRRSSP